eukprot:6869723-Prorocentrum_lima.AAC.1
MSIIKDGLALPHFFRWNPTFQRLALSGVTNKGLRMDGGGAQGGDKSTSLTQAMGACTETRRTCQAQYEM